MEADIYVVNLKIGGYLSHTEYVKAHKKAETLKEAGLIEHVEPFDDSAYKKQDDSGEDIFAGYEHVGILKSSTLYLNHQQLVKLVTTGVDFDFKSKVSVDLGDMFLKVAGKEAESPVAQENYYNQKCEVHMPGNLMASYNDLLLLEDCCTDEVQRNLERGYRLIAVCPQPVQRRPDYILGRFNPENSFVGEGAARKGENDE